MELIASEILLLGVMECLGSILTYKYGRAVADSIMVVVSTLMRLKHYVKMSITRLNKEQWGVNVQPNSGSPAIWQYIMLF